MFLSSFTAKTLTELDYIIWVTRRGFYERQGLLTPHKHQGSPPVFWGGPCCSSFLVFVLSYYVSTFGVPCCDVRYDFRINRCSVRLYLQMFVGGCMSYLRYLCVFAYSVVQHILYCVLVLFVFVLCTISCQLLWIVLFWSPFRYSLTFTLISRHVLSP